METTEMDPEEIARRLRAGQLVVDGDFDVWLPSAARPCAERYWTQVGVTMRVSRWLEARGVTSVLDVGSGAGKFCVVGALSSRMTFTGIEQRGYLVDAALALAERFAVAPRTSFVRGDLDAVDFRDFGALYFYNPFGENMFPRRAHLDDTVEVGRARFARDVETVRRLLGRMPPGSHMVTYNGCGARIPDTYELVRARVAGLNLLRLWRKARDGDDGGYWLELEETTILRTAAARRDA